MLDRWWATAGTSSFSTYYNVQEIAHENGNPYMDHRGRRPN
jgi:hypothetical protein